MIPSSYQRIEDDSNIPNGHSSDETEPKWRSRLRNFAGRIRRVDRGFIVSKLFYLFFYTALGALFPFFALFYKQLWLAAWQIGLLLALRPTVKLVCLPLWKMITDQYSRPKAVYFISIFGWLLGYYGQSFVYQSDVPCYAFTKLRNDAAATSLPQLPNISQDTNYVPLSTHILKSRNIKHIPLDSVSLRPWDPVYYRKNARGKNKLATKARDNVDYEGKRAPKFHLNSHVASLETKTPQKQKLSQTRKSSFISSRERDRSESDGLEHGHGDLAEETESEKLNLILDEINSNDNDISTGKSSRHRNRRSIEAFDEIKQQSPHPARDFRVLYNYWIFRTLIVIVILTEIVTTPTPMLADIAIVQALVDTDSEYGKQRLFGSLGLTIAAALVAIWITQITDCPSTDTINYLPCFYVFEIAIGITVVVSLFFDFETRREEQYEFKEAMKLFFNFKNGIFLFTLFIFGFAHGVQMSFLFWFLQDIGGGPVLFALIVLVHCLAEVVTYFTSTFLVNKIGQQGMICLALACYTARFLMYSNLKDPWLVLPMEIVQGITYGGVWSIAAVYINAPAEATSTVQSILHGAYWGVGMAFGSAVSGVVIYAAGARLWFLIVCIVCFVLCIIHAFIDMTNRVNVMEEEARERKTEAEGEGAAKDIQPQPTGFIGVAAAPMVPCLLYAK